MNMTVIVVTLIIAIVVFVILVFYRIMDYVELKKYETMKSKKIEAIMKYRKNPLKQVAKLVNKRGKD